MSDTTNSPRLLDCGLCYEEQGEEVHPHPECPIGRVAPVARYRPRAAEVEAVQWTGSNADVLRAFTPERFATTAPDERIDPEDDALVLIEESHWVAIRPGCWVLRYADHFDVDSDADFRAGYVPAGPAPAAEAVAERIAQHLAAKDHPAEVWAHLTEPCRAAYLADAREVVTAAGLAPATDRAALRDRIAAAIADALQPRYGGPQHNTPGGLPLTATAEEVRLHRAQPLAEAVLAVLPASLDRADVLREADEAGTRGLNHPDCETRDYRTCTLSCPIHGEPEPDAANVLRRMADEPPQPETEQAAIASCPGYETSPNPCRCPCYGCKHHCGAHDPDAVEAQQAEEPFVPPAHYRRDDGVLCCVHTIPIGPDSCRACRELADGEQPAAGPTAVDEVVAALQAKAQTLSVEAEEEMRRDLEEQAQVWHEAAELARRTGRKAQRRTKPQGAASVQPGKEA